MDNLGVADEIYAEPIDALTFDGAEKYKVLIMVSVQATGSYVTSIIIIIKMVIKVGLLDL